MFIRAAPLGGTAAPRDDKRTPSSKTMSEPDCVSFASHCPKGHQPTLVFSRQTLQGKLEDGSLQFWCNLCGDSWKPSEDEQRRIKIWLSRLVKPFWPQPPFFLDKACPRCRCGQIEVTDVRGDASYDGHCPQCRTPVFGVLLLLEPDKATEEAAEKPSAHE
jgi:hypothetical protein